MKTVKTFHNFFFIKNLLLNFYGTYWIIFIVTVQTAIILFAVIWRAMYTCLTRKKVKSYSILLLKACQNDCKSNGIIGVSYR